MTRWRTGLAVLTLLALCWLYTADTRLDRANADPWFYLHAAQTLRAGLGLRNLDFGNPVTQAISGPPDALFATWPPLYPVVLALLGADLHAARIMNAGGLWLSLILGWVLLRRFAIHAAVCIGAMVACALFMNDAQRTFLTASSETLFIPLFWAWIIAATHLRHPRDVLLMALLGTAAALTRYIGIPLLALSALRIAGVRGWWDALAYACLPGMALTWWLTRNFYTYGRLTGHSQPGDYNLSVTLQHMTGVLIQWTQLLILCAGTAYLLAWCWQAWSRRTVRSSSSVA